MERRAQIPKPPSDPPPAPERKPNGEPAEEPEERPPVPPPGPPYEIPPEPPPAPRAYWSRKAAVTPGQPALHHDAQRRKAGSDGHAGAPPPSARRSAGAGRTPYPGSPPFGTASSPAVPRPWLTPRCSSAGWPSRRKPRARVCAGYLPSPTCGAGSPRCWRWSSGRLRRRHLSTNFEFSRRRDSLSAPERLSRKCGNV